MSARSSSSKSPTIGLTPLALAQPAKLPASRLVTRQLPSPCAKAIGIVPQSPPRRISAMSERPSPSKSPTSGSTPLILAQAAKRPVLWLVMRQLPSPRAKAIGIVPQSPLRRISATSERPSPSKSPTSGLTPARSRPGGEAAGASVGDAPVAFTACEGDRHRDPVPRSGESA